MLALLEMYSIISQAVVAFNPGTEEAEAGGSVNSSPAWSIE